MNTILLTLELCFRSSDTNPLTPYLLHTHLHYYETNLSHAVGCIKQSTILDDWDNLGEKCHLFNNTEIIFILWVYLSTWMM